MKRFTEFYIMGERSDFIIRLYGFERSMLDVQGVAFFGVALLRHCGQRRDLDEVRTEPGDFLNRPTVRPRRRKNGSKDLQNRLYSMQPLRSDRSPTFSRYGTTGIAYFLTEISDAGGQNDWLEETRLHTICG